MTISSSLNAGVSGLTANASRLSTISDNIANSSTFGYKRSEVDFTSMVMGSGSGSYTAGGVRTTSFKVVDEGGSLVTTNNSTDLAVRGRGYLPVARAPEVALGNGNPTMFLATTGSFRPDASGHLQSESGLILMGWPADADGTIPNFPRETADGLEPVQINVNQLDGEPTTEITLGVNLPATETESTAAGDDIEMTVEYLDNLGRSETLSLTFTPTIPATASSNEWTVVIEDSATDAALNPVGEYTITFNDSRSAGGTIASAVVGAAGGAFDAVTGAAIITTAAGDIELNFGVPGTNSGLTQLSDTFAPTNIVKDGTPVGNVTSLDVDENGMISAIYETGFTQVIYQVPLADLSNPNGMAASDKQIFLPSPDSGSFVLWDAGAGPTGDIVSFAREESATDVAGELTDMIQTQRAYSSNAKVIQTVDEMLQETTNIKR